jgi:hypothetical protein
VIDPTLSFTDLVKSFMYQSQVASGKRYIGATVHVDFDQLSQLWPDASYIYLVRDPRAVAASYVTIGWASNHWVAVKQWLRCEQQYKSVCREIGHERIMRIRYEDLVTDCSDVLTGIFEFIGVEPLPGPIDELTTSTRTGLPKTTREAAWRTEMAPSEIALVEARAGSELRRSGYELTMGQVPHVGRIGIFLLELDNRLAKIWLELSRYGIRRVVDYRIRSLLRLSSAEDIADELDTIRRRYGRNRQRAVTSSLILRIPLVRELCQAHY